jgi:hypothetical protein
MVSYDADGKAHALEAEADVRLLRSNGPDRLIDWLEVRDAPVPLTHPQHAPLRLAAGIWRVVRQRQYDPARGWEASHPRRLD